MNLNLFEYAPFIAFSNDCIVLFFNYKKQYYRLHTMIYITFSMVHAP